MEPDPLQSPWRRSDKELVPFCCGHPREYSVSITNVTSAPRPYHPQSSSISPISLFLISRPLVYREGTFPRNVPWHSPPLSFVAWSRSTVSSPASSLRGGPVPPNPPPLHSPSLYREIPSTSIRLPGTSANKSKRTPIRRRVFSLETGDAISLAKLTPRLAISSFFPRFLCSHPPSCISLSVRNPPPPSPCSRYVAPDRASFSVPRSLVAPFA